MKAILRFVGSKALTPLLRAAAARLTTPVPRSTRYGVPLTTMAVQGPERSGSGNGVPVPRRTIWVCGAALSCASAAQWIVETRSIAATARQTRRAGGVRLHAGIVINLRSDRVLASNKTSAQLLRLSGR